MRNLHQHTASTSHNTPTISAHSQRLGEGGFPYIACNNALSNTSPGHVLKQYVGPLQYVDDLIQTALNQAPSNANLDADDNLAAIAIHIVVSPYVAPTS